MCIVQWRIDNKENFSQRGGCIIQRHSARAEIHLTYSMHSTYGSFYETVQGISYICVCGSSKDIIHLPPFLLGIDVVIDIVVVVVVVSLLSFPPGSL